MSNVDTFRHMLRWEVFTVRAFIMVVPFESFGSELRECCDSHSPESLHRNTIHSIPARYLNIGSFILGFEMAK